LLHSALQRSLDDQSLRTVLADYVADAGGLVACLDLIAITVAEHGLTKRTSRAIENLADEVDSVLARVRELRDETERAVATCRSIETLRLEADRLAKLHGEASDQHDKFAVDLGQAIQQLRLGIESRSREIDRDAETRTGVVLLPASDQQSALALDRKLPIWTALNRSVRDDGPLIWGEVSFDIFNAFDAPLSAHGTNLLEQFARDVNTTLAGLGVSSSVLESSTLPDGFSLHGSSESEDDRKTIDDAVAFFEFKTTTLKRMERAVIQRIIEVVTTMRLKVSARMSQQLDAAFKVADEHLDGLRQRVSNLDGLLKQQRETEAALRRQTAPEQARVYEMRLADLSRLTSRIEEFRARVMAESTNCNAH
jgi:hypothetical protein